MLCLVFLTLNVDGYILTDRYIIKELQDICKHRGLSIVHQIIRGLQTNFENLCAVVDIHNIDIITLSHFETHLTNSEPQDLYCIDGYNLVTRNRVDG